jgi:hypothetical protein
MPDCVPEEMRAIHLPGLTLRIAVDGTAVVDVPMAGLAKALEGYQLDDERAMPTSITKKYGVRSR